MESPASSPSKHFKTWLLTEIVDYRRRSQLEPEHTLRLARRDGSWMRQQIAYYQGKVTGLSGDCNSGLQACFEDNENAFHCAVALQEGLVEALGTASHPGQVLAHRLGLHFGEVQDINGVTVGECLTTARCLRDRAEANEIILSHPTVVMLGGSPARQPVFEGEKQLEQISAPVGIYRLPPPQMTVATAAATDVNAAENPADFGVSEETSAADIGITADPNAAAAARRVAALRQSLGTESPNQEEAFPGGLETLQVKAKKPETGSGGATVAGTAKFQRQREGRITASGDYPVVFLAVQQTAEKMKAKAPKPKLEKGVLNLSLTGWLRRAYLELLFYQSGSAIVVDATGRRENKHHAQTIEKLFTELCAHPVEITYADLKACGYDARAEAPEHRPSVRASPFGNK